MKTIQPTELYALIAAGHRVDLIDVRTPVEFDLVHATPARLVPLDQLDPAALLQARNGHAGEPLYVICKSGSRGAKACEKLVAAGCQNVINVAGGTAAWLEAGLPVVRGATKVISLERQVRIAAGLFVLLGAALGWLVHPGFYGLCALVGAGLVFAGITDACCMGMLMARMPWNRRSGNCATGCCST